MEPKEHNPHPSSDAGGRAHAHGEAAAEGRNEAAKDPNTATPQAPNPAARAGGKKAMNANATDPFPDVHDQPLPYPESDVPDPRNQATKEANALHDRVYEAVMYVLVNDFQFLQGRAPPQQSAFPGDLDEDEQSLFLAVYGILLADGWDPTMGKTEPGPDDTIITETKHFVVRRFVDAAVAAVQEYTSNAPLFKGVYGQLGGGDLQTGQTSVH